MAQLSKRAGVTSPSMLCAVLAFTDGWSSAYRLFCRVFAASQIKCFSQSLEDFSPDRSVITVLLFEWTKNHWGWRLWGIVTHTKCANRSSHPCPTFNPSFCKPWPQSFFNSNFVVLLKCPNLNLNLSYMLLLASDRKTFTGQCLCYCKHVMMWWREWTVI